MNTTLPKDTMTPLERMNAMLDGHSFDRYPSCPSISEQKHTLLGISTWDFWHDPVKMAETEIYAFRRFGYDKITIGPNTRGITEALGGTFVYPDNSTPYVETPFLNDYGQLAEIEPVNAMTHSRMEPFSKEAEILQKELSGVIQLSTHIGGPFTIASNLRGIERFLRDCRKCPDNVKKLLRIIADSQKSCIDWAAYYNLAVCMADPVAIPDLIGPKMYEEFIYPITKELTEYTYQKTGKKVFLHMCGNTRSIWKYFKNYPLFALSLDNVIDLKEAIKEMGDNFIITGNVDPVNIVLNGSKEIIFDEIKRMIDIGRTSRHGFILAAGCDLPASTPLTHVDWFMEAARLYN